MHARCHSVTRVFQGRERLSFHPEFGAPTSKTSAASGIDNAILLSSGAKRDIADI
jgi:hypothetical protein